MIVIRNPEWFKAKYAMWSRFVYRFVFSKAERILTVSNFSRNEINKCYPKYKGEINVVSEGWQHIVRINKDGDIDPEYILKKYGLIKNKYIFSNYQKVPYKNFQWIVETAKNNEEMLFAITGWRNSKVHVDQKEELPSNVKMLGYISDIELKILIQNCYSFVFPSLSEGFGLPPI